MTNEYFVFTAADPTDYWKKRCLKAEDSLAHKEAIAWHKGVTTAMNIIGVQQPDIHLLNPYKPFEARTDDNDD